MVNEKVGVASNKIIESVRENGIVGAGGAGFPTYVKINSKVDTVIVNGAECEPLLENDKYLMRFMADEIIKGLEYIIEATQAERGFVALKSKYNEIIFELKKAVGKISNIKIFAVSDFYPAGDEDILVYEVTGRIVPEGGIPLDVGCVVNNVETVLNIYEAVENDRPVTMRYLTCTGEVKEPAVVHAHIGVPISEILGLCGGPTVDNYTIIIGGPMMGRIERDENAPVTKTMSSIIVLPSEHRLVQNKLLPLEYMVKMSRSVCCQCTECTELCPRYLIGHNIKPHLIMRQINYGLEFPPEIIESAFLCSECGVCEYACSMGLSPRKISQKIKESFSDQNYKPQSFKNDLPVNEMREYRKVPTSRLIQRLNLEEYTHMNLKKGIKTNPDRVELMLKQHIGEKSKPAVKVGDKVNEGSIVAKIPNGAIGSNIHSSIKGKVIFIDEDRIIIER